MKLYNTLPICLILLISTNSYATLGGPEEIQVLGYDQKDKKVYVLRQFNDDSCKLPQLYYFNLNSKTQPHQAIPVQSIYMSEKTKNKIEYCSDEEDVVMKRIEHIQKRLKPLNSIPTQGFLVKLKQRQIKTGQFWQKVQEDYPVQRYTQHYVIEYQKQKSLVQKSISYHHAELNITRAYALPQHNTSLVIVQYLGIPYETGYTIDDPILIR